MRNLGAHGKLRLLVVATIVALPAVAGGPAVADGANTRRDPVTVFVAGDSTAATYPVRAMPRAGWGQALPAFLDPRHIGVDNEALSGASSKSFVEAGLLDRILAAIRPGDYLLISFGHNDEKADERHTDPFTTYQQYLLMYIDGARRLGARPVLVTPVERRRFDAEGHATASHGDYPRAMRELGARVHVPVIDLTTMSMRLWDQLGVEGTKEYFLWLAAGESSNYPDGVEDNTHFQAHGAIEVARVVVRALVDQHILPRHDTVRLRRAVPDNALSWPSQASR